MHDPLTHLRQAFLQPSIDMLKGACLIAGAVMESYFGQGLIAMMVLFGILHMIQAMIAMDTPEQEMSQKRIKIPLKQGKVSPKRPSPPPLPNNILQFENKSRKAPTGTQNQVSVQ